MKNFILLLAIFVFISFILKGQTTVPGGNISGTWALSGSPYLIQGHVMIPDNLTLTIEPGVTVNFQGAYKLYVQGRIIAIGTVTDTITFTATDTASGWQGIQFDNTPVTNDSSKFYYCKLQYGKSTSGGGAINIVGFPKIIISNCNISHCRADAYPGGGAIRCAGGNTIIKHCIISDNYTIYNGGGICCENSNPSILHNTFSNNAASGVGGAINCSGIYNSSNANISNNIIINNSANNGGGIYCTNNSPKITGNFIFNNTASNGGAIYCFNDGVPVIMNNSIANNTAANGGGGIYCDYTFSSPAITGNTISNNSASKGGALYCSLYSGLVVNNTIIWGNTASTSGNQLYLDDENSDPDFYYCNIQGGTASFGLNDGIFYTGDFLNNIDTLPLFVAPTAGSGNSYNASTADWSLQISSHAINAGTPDTSGLNLPATDILGNLRISGTRIDIGAYEYAFPNAIDEHISACSVDIYPNPADNYLTIETQQKAGIEILDAEGQMIMTTYSIENKTTINIENLARGVYFIRVTTNREVITKKVIKE